MSNLRNTTKHSLTISAAIGACLAFSACGAIAEKTTEEGAERVIEAESGENVERDVDSDGGSFSIETGEGGSSFDDDGTLVVTDGDGSVFTGSANDDDLVATDANDDDLVATDANDDDLVATDANDDDLVATDADGDPVMNVVADGEGEEISIQGDDGDIIYRVDTEIPAEWPSEIPRPDGLVVEAGSYIAAEGGAMITVVGTPTSGSAAEYADNYLGGEASSGFTETGRSDQSADGIATAQRNYENNLWAISVSGADDGESSVVNISVMSK